MGHNHATEKKASFTLTVRRRILQGLAGLVQVYGWAWVGGATAVGHGNRAQDTQRQQRETKRDPRGLAPCSRIATRCSTFGTSRTHFREPLGISELLWAKGAPHSGHSPVRCRTGFWKCSLEHCRTPQAFSKCTPHVNNDESHV